MRLILGLTFLGAAFYGFTQWQQTLRAAAPMLDVTFAHIDHGAVNCVACHHNYTDDTGHGLCFDCHKSDPRVNALMERQFHQLCMDCHVSQQALDEDGGPTRACFACHEGDEAP